MCHVLNKKEERSTVRGRVGGMPNRLLLSPLQGKHLLCVFLLSLLVI